MGHVLPDRREPTQVSYELTDRDVSNWDLASKAWKVTSGEYGVLVGSSSKDIRLDGTMTVTA